MLDKSCNGINPPTHELLILEEPSLFLCRFIGEYVADFYQIRPCDGERVEGIHLFLGEPHAWTVLQTSLNDIAAQTYSTLLGKRLELLQLFFSTSYQK